jgi:hypothetical protein
MTTTTLPEWKEKTTVDSQVVVDLLRQHGFAKSDAYRFNAASIRVRVIDDRFEGLSHEDRDGLIEPILDLLPLRIQGDIVNLQTWAPSDFLPNSKNYAKCLYLNGEFEHPHQ